MTMFEGPLVITHCSFQPCKTREHKHIVGVHLVGAPSIRERFGIAISLGTVQNTEPAQRVARETCGDAAADLWLTLTPVQIAQSWSDRIPLDWGLAIAGWKRGLFVSHGSGMPELVLCRA